jgi:hypothetical protein
MTDTLSPSNPVKPPAEPTPPGGPAAFDFIPAHPQHRGPSFGPVFKALAWCMNAALLFWMLRLRLPWGQSLTVWAWAAWAMMFYSTWVVQRSRLRIGDGLIAQDWMWRKQVAICDLASLRLIRVRGLEWLMAPRVYTRTLQGRPMVFYCADPMLLSEFERMGRELASWREKILRGD